MYDPIYILIICSRLLTQTLILNFPSFPEPERLRPCLVWCCPRPQAAKLQLEASQLVSENEVLQEQLDTLLSKVDVLQNQNGAMKAMLLQACHSSGIAVSVALRLADLWA